jgi:3-carboxy-cis,cis-muconate cycloisomerase
MNSSSALSHSEAIYVKQARYFTDGRVKDACIDQLFSLEHRWQRWLDVESALATAEARVGIIPPEAAASIKQAAILEKLDSSHVYQRMLSTSHPLMALIEELSDTVGDPYGGWVHWGATTQNIMQTGDVLVVREAHLIIQGLLYAILSTTAKLADESAGIIMAGRTHGQHAVPITFGFKVASWIDELLRHLERLKEVEPRAFIAMTGGAVGNFASLGERGPAVQAYVAQELELVSMNVPSRSVYDSFAEYVCILGLLASTAGRIVSEVYTLMKTEYGEVHEPTRRGTVGSSTMPHKYNPQLSDDCLAIVAQIRAMVPVALDSMIQDHEANGGSELMIYNALHQSCTLTGDLLERLYIILDKLEVDDARMRHNLDLTNGLISSEKFMLALGKKIGRQLAHEIVYEAAQKVIHDKRTFIDSLAADPRVSAHFGRSQIEKLLDPINNTGLSEMIAHATAKRARLAIESALSSRSNLSRQQASKLVVAR